MLVCVCEYNSVHLPIFISAVCACISKYVHAWCVSFRACVFGCTCVCTCIRVRACTGTCTFANIFMLLQSSSVRVHVFVKVLESVRACHSVCISLRVRV